MERLEQWLFAVAQHHPGSTDDASTRIGKWPASHLRSLRVDVQSLVMPAMLMAASPDSTVPPHRVVVPYADGEPLPVGIARVQDFRGSTALACCTLCECYSTHVVLSIELEREDDGRWLAEVPALPGVMCYGADRDDAVARVQALAFRVIAERLEHREAPAELLNVWFRAA